jgi:hypothetical protein
MNFLIKHWPKIGTVLALILTPILLYYRSEMGLPLFLIWMQVPIYLLHQTEEYLIPGGFIEHFNRVLTGKATREGPLDESRAFWVNVLLVWVIFPIVAAFATYLGNLSIGIYLLYFSVANGLMHVINGIRFAAYNPGFVISLFLNVIIGLYGIMVLQGTGTIWWPNHIISAIVAILINVWLIVSMKLKMKALQKADLSVTG